MKQAITQYLMVIMLVVGAYMLGVYKTKVTYLEKGAPNAAPQAAGNTAQPTAPTTIDLAKVKDQFDGKHITFGDKNAAMVITEVSDPSCPYCHIAGGLHPDLNNQSAQFKMVKDGGTYVAPVPEIRKLVEAGKASFLWIYSPGHGSGEVGTAALYCAYEQGKFWEAHDILMSKSGYELLNNVVKNDLTQSAKVVSLMGKALDSKKLQACLDSKKYLNQPDEDSALVSELAAPAQGFGTPTFFVNNKVVEGAQPWSSIEGLL